MRLTCAVLRRSLARTAATWAAAAVTAWGADSPAAPQPLARAHSHNDYLHARPLLDALDHGFCSIEADVFLLDVSPLLVPVVSEQWSKFFRWRGQGLMPPDELARLKEFVAKAHAHGRKLRLWGAPDFPSAWRVLYENEMDLINTDNHPGLRDFLAGAGAR